MTEALQVTSDSAEKPLSKGMWAVGLIAALVIEWLLETLKSFTAIFWGQIKWLQDHAADAGEAVGAMCIMALCIAAIVLLLWFLETKTRFRNRVWMVVCAALLFGAFEPSRLLKHAEDVEALRKVTPGETHRALRNAVKEDPWLDEEKGRYWKNQVVYDLPSVFTVQLVTVELDSDDKVVSVDGIKDSVW